MERARQCAPPQEIESGKIVGGFAHNQVLALADKVIDAVKSGAVKRFVVMAGCDGRQKSRSYYTEVAENLPEDTVILTAGCAKYRYNKLDLGDIGGIPRVLDAGQGLSEHTAPFDAMVYILDGEAEITIGGQPQVVVAGEMLIVPANVAHALHAKTPLKMLLVMIRGELNPFSGPGRNGREARGTGCPERPGPAGTSGALETLSPPAAAMQRYRKYGDIATDVDKS